MQGERVSFTGTLASMTHEEAQALVEKHGGTATQHVSHGTSMLVLGEEGWPLEEDGQPSQKLQRVNQWREEGLEIRVVSEGGYRRAMAVAVVLPPVVRALDAIAHELAVRERGAPMGADVTQAVNVACRVAKQNEVLAEHAHADQLVGDVLALFSGIPEIDKHSELFLP